MRKLVKMPILIGEPQMALDNRMAAEYNKNGKFITMEV